MDIQFREFNPFDLWIWIDYGHRPAPAETQYVEELFNSWFYLGKLGAFNAENLQVQDMGVDLSYMTYDRDRTEQALMAPMHNMGEFEYEGNWGRCWFDLGTSDPLALDILLNALSRLSEEYLELKRIVIGGENDDWPVPEESRSVFS